MWYKVRELQSKGLNKTQIGKHLGVDRSTVRRYLQMSREDFVRRRNSHRKYTLKLAGYEEYVRGTLEEYPYISAARIHDWLKECYPDFPEVCDKTVFNFVEKVRCKYGIGKKSEARIRRDYEKLPDTPYGEYAQADFGEKWMSAGNGRSTKVYFFAIVLARSRYKFTFFARRPFDTELAIYAHECAFEYFGGKPEKILYDQDRVLISRENLGDLMLTRKFQTFVREQHFQPVFCHKADPESKGKVENVVKYVKENFLVARVFRDIDSLNREALEWLERTGNGKVHGTTRLVPREDFAVEKGFLMPYHGTPQPPQEEMREYHVRKDNTVQYRGNYYSLPCGTYRSGQTTVWLQETEGNVELYNKDTGKLICRHALCTRKGRTVYDDSHRKPRNAGVKIAERILVHVFPQFFPLHGDLFHHDLQSGRQAILFNGTHEGKFKIFRRSLILLRTTGLIYLLHRIDPNIHKLLLVPKLLIKPISSALSILPCFRYFIYLFLAGCGFAPGPQKGPYYLSSL